MHNVRTWHQKQNRGQVCVSVDVRLKNKKSEKSSDLRGRKELNYKFVYTKTVRDTKVSKCSQKENKFSN